MKKNILIIIMLLILIPILISCKNFNTITSLNLEKSTINLEVGQTEKLNLTVKPSNKSFSEIIWSVSDEKIAKVDDNGIVRAISTGDCVITVKTKDGVLSAKSNVIVKPKSVKELKLDISSLNVEVGSSGKLNVILEPADAEVPEIQWISSDEKIATVDNNGVVTAVSVGIAKVTAKIKYGVLSADSNIVVKGKSAKGIKFNKTAIKLQEGSSESLQITFVPSDTSNKKVTYSSSNTKIATVDSKGLLKAIAQGTAVITVKSEDGNFTSECTVTVNPKVISPTSTVPSPTSTNMLFKKSGVGEMQVIIYEHLAWVDASKYSSNIEIYIENSKLNIKFNDIGLTVDGKTSWGLTNIYDVGTGVTVKQVSSGKVLFEIPRTNQ